MTKFLRLVAALLLFTLFAQAKELAPVLFAPYESADAVAKKLTEGGYEVVGSYSSLPDSKTIIFTDETLKQEAAKKNRAFMAVLRAFVDEKNKRISISNPLYYGKAFMQDDYKDEPFRSEYAKLEKIFGKLTPSDDTLDEDDLAGYHFMMGMPYYEDQIEVGGGSTSSMLRKLKPKAIFVLKLSNGAVLVGFDLGDDIEKFADKIGRQNASLLPWMVKIEGKEATILAPKYYIAISYPNLSMADFMEIKRVPGDIEDKIKDALR